MRFLRAAFAALLFTATFSVHAGVGIKSVTLIPSGDGDMYSRFPNGDKPIDVCNPPTGYTEANVGDGGGEVCVSPDEATWTFNAIGSSSIQKNHYAYKSAGTGDFEIKARILDQSTGNLDPLASIGIGVRNGTGATDYFFQCFSPYSTGFIIQVNYGTSASDATNVNDAPGQVRPRWCAITWDDSATDLRAWVSADGSSWTQIAQIINPGLVSNPLVYGFGQSKSSSAVYSNSFDGYAFATSLSIYTPDPPPTGAPTCTAIPNQNGTQSVSFSLNIAPFCSDPDGGAITFAAAGTGACATLSACGLSMSTAGLLTGTPNSTARGASPFNVIVTVTDDEADEGTATFQLTIAPEPGNGDTFGPYGSSVTEINCTAAETATRKGQGAGPGDTIIINGGTRGALLINDCAGSPSSYLSIVNDTTDSVPVTISSSATYPLIVQDLIYVTIDGTGKWSGAGSNGCGNLDNPDKMQPPPGTRNCGFVVAPTGTPTSFVKLRGTTKFLTIKGLECNGAGNGARNCLGMNDHQTKLVGVTQLQCQTSPNGACKDQWREGIVLEDNYIHDTNTEATYVGANANTTQIDDWPLRCNKIRGNYIKNSGWDALSLKSNISDSTCWSEITDNYVDGAGVISGPGNEPADGNSGACITVFEGGYVIVARNVVRDCAGAGIAHNSQNRPAAYGPLPATIQNNVVVRGGVTNDKRGINVGAIGNGDLSFDDLIQNNTIVDAGSGGIGVGSGNANCRVRANLLAASTAAKRSISASLCTPTNNLQDTVANMNFDNAGADDYRLTTSSPARQQASTAPADDFEGDTRPKQTFPDIGADEYAP